MLDAMDVNASITQLNTTNPEIDEFYAAQIDRLIGLGREDLVRGAGAEQGAEDQGDVLADRDRVGDPGDDPAAELAGEGAEGLAVVRGEGLLRAQRVSNSCYKSASASRRCACVWIATSRRHRRFRYRRWL